MKTTLTTRHVEACKDGEPHVLAILTLATLGKLIYIACEQRNTLDKVSHSSVTFKTLIIGGGE